MNEEEGEEGDIFVQWSLLSYERIDNLLELSVDQVQMQFEDVLGLKNHQTCVIEAALLDYYVAGFWWAKEMDFTCQQISFIMALLQLLLDNIKDKHMQFADCFKEFVQTLLASTKPSPRDINPLFDSNQIKSITDYITSSLFQHYRMYEFLFTYPRDEMLLGMEKCIEVVNSDDFAAPLEEGMPAKLYFHYIAPPQMLPEQGEDKSPEKSESESGECEQTETLESLEDISVEDIQDVLGEMANEMLEKLQADFMEKLRIQEETYMAKLERLKGAISK